MSKRKFVSYNGCGKTPEEAFCSIWELMKYREDYLCRKTMDGYEIKIKLVVPTPNEQEIYETNPTI